MLDDSKKKKLKPQCIAGTKQAAVTNRGHLVPCIWLDDPIHGALNHPTMKSLLKVSKVSEVDDIEEIVSTKEWRDWYKNLEEENLDKVLPTCKVQCKVKNDEIINKIKNKGMDLLGITPFESD